MFITGGNSGIGKTSALEPVREGAIVVVADLIGKVDGETIAEIKAPGVESMIVPIDVSDI